MTREETLRDMDTLTGKLEALSGRMAGLQQSFLTLTKTAPTMATDASHKPKAMASTLAPPLPGSSSPSPPQPGGSASPQPEGGAHHPSSPGQGMSPSGYLIHSPSPVMVAQHMDLVAQLQRLQQEVGLSWP